MAYVLISPGNFSERCLSPPWCSSFHLGFAFPAVMEMLHIIFVPSYCMFMSAFLEQIKKVVFQITVHGEHKATSCVSNLRFNIRELLSWPGILSTLLWWEISLKGMVLPSVIPMGFPPGRKLFLCRWENTAELTKDRPRSRFCIKLSWINWLLLRQNILLPTASTLEVLGGRIKEPRTSVLSCAVKLPGYRKTDGGSKKRWSCHLKCSGHQQRHLGLALQ